MLGHGGRGLVTLDVPVVRIPSGTENVPMDEGEHLSRAEIGKDAVQHTVEAATTMVGQVASIMIGAVRDVAHVLGGFATEVFEIREAARKAARD